VAEDGVPAAWASAAAPVEELADGLAGVAGVAAVPVEGDAGVAGVAEVVPDGVVWADGISWPDGVVPLIGGVVPLAPGAPAGAVDWAKAAPASERVAAAAK
jgi:hypothetical protein